MKPLPSIRHWLTRKNPASPTPLQAIAAWLYDQSESQRLDIMIHVVPYLFDDYSQLLRLQILPLWLAENDLDPFELVGRVVRFRACIEFIYKRTTPSLPAWETLVEKHISDEALAKWFRTKDIG